MVVQGSTTTTNTTNTTSIIFLPQPTKKELTPYQSQPKNTKKITYFVINNKTQYTYSIDTILLCTLQKKITLSFKK